MIVSSTLDNNYEIKYGSEIGTWEYNRFSGCWMAELSDDLTEKLIKSKRSLVLDCQHGHMTLVRADKDPYLGDQIRLSEGQYSLVKSISSMKLKTISETVDNTPLIDFIEGNPILKVKSTPHYKRSIYDSTNIIGEPIKIQVTKTTFSDPEVEIIFGGTYDIESDNQELSMKLSKGLELDSIEFKNYLYLSFPDTFDVNSAKFYIIDKDEIELSDIDLKYHTYITICNVSSIDSDFSIKDGDKLLFKAHIDSNGRTIMDIGKDNSEFPSSLKITDLEIPIDINIDQYDGTGGGGGGDNPKSSITMIADDGSIQSLKVKNVGTQDDPDYTIELTEKDVNS